MIIVVTGGRDFNDRTAVFSALGLLHKQFPITELIEGGASGVDNLCKQWAQLHGIHVRYINYHGATLTLHLRPEKEPLSVLYENDRVVVTVPEDLMIDVEVR